MTTTSPLPWQLNGTELIDACGNLVGTFKDWKDAEAVLECVQYFRSGEMSAKELGNCVTEMSDELDALSLKKEGLRIDLAKREEEAATLVQQIEALKRENAELSLRESVAVTKNEELISEITNARAALKKALEAV